jgi:hypothetical protein
VSLGALISSTSRVIAIAKNPSLNVSIRSVVISATVVRWRVIDAYEISTATRQTVETMDGNQPGDPA